MSSNTATEVIKIGGAVLKSIEGFNRFIHIVNKSKADRLLVVISAFSNASRELTRSAYLAESGKLDDALLIIDAIVADHLGYASLLVSNDDNLKSLNKEVRIIGEKLNQIIQSIHITADMSLRILDMLMSYGEVLALIITDYFLNDKLVPHKIIHSTEIIVTDDDFGSAKPIEDATVTSVNNVLLPLFNDNRIIITQGFIARSETGDITTMGFESSNLTATLLAKLLGVKELRIYTNVMGIMTADPEIVDSTSCIHELSYSQAYQLSVNGLKLIYPEMIGIASSSDISVIYCNAFSDEEITSVISDKCNRIGPMITYRTGLKYFKYGIDNKSFKSELALYLNDLASNKDVYNLSISSSGISFLYSGIRKQPIPDSKLQFEIIDSISAIYIFGINQDSKPELLNYLKDNAPKVIFLNIEENNGYVLIKSENLHQTVNELHSILVK